MLNKSFHFLSPVEVVKVTVKNLEEVAEWCGGKIASTESRNVPGRQDKYVWVPTPKGAAISSAFPGMYITKRLVVTVKGELKATWSVFRRDYFDRNYFDTPQDAANATWEKHYGTKKETPVPEQPKPTQPISPSDLAVGSVPSVPPAYDTTKDANTKQAEINAGLPVPLDYEEPAEATLPLTSTEEIKELDVTPQEANDIIDAGVMSEEAKDALKAAVATGEQAPEQVLKDAVGIETPPPIPIAIEDAVGATGAVSAPSDKEMLYSQLDMYVQDAALRMEIKTMIAKGELTIDEAYEMAGIPKP